MVWLRNSWNDYVIEQNALYSTPFVESSHRLCSNASVVSQSNLARLQYSDSQVMASGTNIFVMITSPDTSISQEVDTYSND